MKRRTKKYDKYQCHELNLFLYFKDKDYFSRVARPFVASKMEKTFIDHWLLEDYDSILHYQEIGYFDKLNTLEKTLLIYALMTVDKEKAQMIAKRIALEAKATGKVPHSFKNKLFDTVLSLNLLQKSRDKDEDFMMDDDQVDALNSGKHQPTTNFLA